MPGLLERIDERRTRREDSLPALPDRFINQIVNFTGDPGESLGTLYQRLKGDEYGGGFEGYVRAVSQSPPAFGAQLVRSLLMSQARLRFRRRSGSRGLFGTPALSLLEQPWPKGTTGELLSVMEWHEGLAGNAYVARDADRLRVLRPDWTAIIFGSELDPEDPEFQLDATLLGYLYRPRLSRDNFSFLLPDRVAHWSPLPDPLHPERGMSWLTPVIREIQSDTAATEHKTQYFRNAATPQLVIKGIPNMSPGQFDEIVEMLEHAHTGVRKAFKTLYLVAGADAAPIGANLKDLDYKAIQGSSETRISVASRVPAVVLGTSEGMQGSALNAGNYGQARRNLGDIWLYPTLQSVAAALGQITDVPNDAELWFDTVDMPFIREDAKDAAEIEQLKAATITGLVKEGFTPESAIAAVIAQDMTLLDHTGLVSVQLQPPGTTRQEGSDADEDDDS